MRRFEWRRNLPLIILVIAAIAVLAIIAHWAAVEGCVPYVGRVDDTGSSCQDDSDLIRQRLK